MRQVPVRWIHGLGEQAASFAPLLAHPGLAGLRHVAADLAGYGRAPWPTTPPSLEEVADGIAAELAADEPAVLIGHSLGGVLATMVAERARVRAVVNVDGNLSRGDCTYSGQALAYTREAFRVDGLATIRARVRAAGDAAPLRGYDAAMALASPDVFHRHSVELVALSEAEGLAPRFAALPIPTLFVAGVPDGVCARSRELLARHRVRWVGLEPAGHWVHLDQLDRFVEVVAAFIAGC